MKATEAYPAAFAANGPGHVVYSVRNMTISSRAAADAPVRFFLLAGFANPASAVTTKKQSRHYMLFRVRKNFPPTGGTN